MVATMVMIRIFSDDQDIQHLLWIRIIADQYTNPNWQCLVTFGSKIAVYLIVEFLIMTSTSQMS